MEFDLATISAPSDRTPPPVRVWRWENTLLGWLASLVLHATLMLLLGYFAGQQRFGPGGTGFDSLIGGSGGALTAQFSAATGDGRGEIYFDDERPAMAIQIGAAIAATEGGSATERPTATTASLADIAGGAPPVDALSALPDRLAAALPGGAMSGDTRATGGTTGDPTSAGPTSGGQASGLSHGGRRSGSGQGKFARTHVYEVSGEGRTFVYVFDRSSSMGYDGNNLLASAKQQLLASLGDLGEEHQFHIIFYNQKPTKMDLGRGFSGLVFADSRAKERARRFIEGILAAGGTQHFEALAEAVLLRPDVIFFLTDADEPELSDGQMSEIRSLNRGRSAIHTVEFGDRPRPRPDNFLARIARENGGQYRYVDVRRGDRRSQ